MPAASLFTTLSLFRPSAHLRAAWRDNNLIKENQMSYEQAVQAFVENGGSEGEARRLLDSELSGTGVSAKTLADALFFHGFADAVTTAQMAAGILAERTVDPSQVIYLTNACGEETGYGTLELTEADFAKVPFEDGPGNVLPYVVEIDGEMYVLGNLEVAYEDDFWGEDSPGFQPESVVRADCAAQCAAIRRRLPEVKGSLLLSIDESMPGRFVVGAAIPMEGLTDADATRNALAKVFGMTEAPQFNWLPQASCVRDLLDAAKPLLALASGEERAKLEHAMRVFENVTVLTSWSVDDVDTEDLTPLYSLDERREALRLLSERNTTDEEWDAIYDAGQTVLKQRRPGGKLKITFKDGEVRYADLQAVIQKLENDTSDPEEAVDLVLGLPDLLIEDREVDWDHHHYFDACLTTK